MAVYPSGRKLYSKIRLTPGAAGRRTYQLAAHLGEAEAAARDALMVELAGAMASAGLDPARVVDPLLARLAGADDPEAARVEAYVRTRVLPGRRRPVEAAPTVQQFGEWWTSGELARRYPEQVRARRSARKDAGDLALHVYPRIGDVLVSAVTVEHLEAVLRGLPEKMARSTKAKVLSKVHRLLDLAVYPARYLPANPMPAGLKPRFNRPAFVYLYPAEEAALLGCRAVDVRRRLAYGLAARAGMRIGEVVGLRWGAVDLERGALRLDAHKTLDRVGARVVPLDAPTVRVLSWWREQQGAEGEGSVIGLGVWVGDKVLADLWTAGVRRTELHTDLPGGRSFTFHGFRRGFVTLALGVGQSEDWVMRRTGHTSSAMLHRYRIAAANAAEFGLGWLVDFDVALAETADRLGGQIGPRLATKADESADLQNPRVTPGEPSPGSSPSILAQIQGAPPALPPPAANRGQATDRLARVTLRARRVSALRPSRLLTRGAA